MKLSVVIVSYNVKYYLEQCLLSLKQALKDIKAEIIVVDNASVDNTRHYITSRFPEVIFVQNNENVGFSKANNIAIKQCHGEYVLLLNPDTIVSTASIRQCIDFLDSHCDAGATGVAMLKDNGGFAWESRRGLPTPFTSFCKMTGLCSLFPTSRRFGKYYMRYLDKNEVNEIEVISGAFNMLRKSALDEVGLLDEDFFMYGEDIDLSYRLLKGGYKNYYQPVPILHYKGESTHKSSFRYVHVFYHAMLIFFDKHYSKSYRWLSPIIRLAVVMRGVLDYCLRQRDLIRKFLGLYRNHDAELIYLFLGNKDTIPSVCNLALNHSLRMDFIEASAEKMSDGHMSVSVDASAYDYIVYDTSAFNYDQILAIMNISGDKGKVRLGTYTKETGNLITINNVYTVSE